MKCKPRKYANGGQVSEYGKPTYGRALLARVGIGDGWGNPKKGKAVAKPKRMTVANAAQELPNALAKRRKMLDET